MNNSGVLNKLGLPDDEDMSQYFEDGGGVDLVLHEVGRTAANSPEILRGREFLYLLHWIKDRLLMLSFDSFQLTSLIAEISLRMVDTGKVLCNICMFAISTTGFYN